MTRGLDLLQGTLDLIVLKSLSWGPMHGFGLSRWIQHTTEDLLQVETGSLYPALQRLLVNGWVTAEWGASENNRRARFYTITAAGKKRLAAERAEFERIAGAIARVLQLA